MRIDRCLIDANWGQSTDVVYQFCRQSGFAGILLPSHGKYVGASSIPFSEYKRKRGDRVGLHWRIPNTIGKRQVRHVLIDTNYWKTFVHARLAVAMGDPGCLSLFGRDEKAHRLLADHLTAEYRVKTAGPGPDGGRMEAAGHPAGQPLAGLPGRLRRGGVDPGRGACRRRGPGRWAPAAPAAFGTPREQTLMTQATRRPPRFRPATRAWSAASAGAGIS